MDISAFITLTRRTADKALHAAAMLLLSLVAASAGAQSDPVAAYREGVDLIDRYSILSDRKAADADTLRARAELQRGIALLATVTADNPEHWPAWWFSGKAQQALGDHAAAYDAFHRAYEIKPDHPDVGRELVMEAICVRRNAWAAVLAQEIARSHPADAGLLANAALALLADGQTAVADAAVTRALAMSPADRITIALRDEIARVRGGGKPRDYCRN